MMRRVLLLLLCLALVAGNAWAVDIQRPPEGTVIPSIGEKQDCTFGNPGAPAWIITGWGGDWIWIKLVVWPPMECSCPTGFHIENLSFSVYLDGDFDDPIVVPIWIDLEDGWWRDDPGCFFPGEIDCVTQTEMTFQGSGYVTATLPMLDCPCAYMAYVPEPPVPGFEYGPYLISLRFPVVGDGLFYDDPDNLLQDIFPVITDDPTVRACTSFINETDDITLFEDLVTALGGEYGDWVISAEATCCEDPVGIEDSSWGDVKSLFR